MSGFTRSFLAAMTGLVLWMIVLDPHEAHRPPELRNVPGIAAMDAAIG